MIDLRKDNSMSGTVTTPPLKVVQPQTHEEFRALIARDFGLSYSIYKEKLAYDMIYWADGKDGSVWGQFAGHGHNCRLCGFDRGGWCYVWDGSWHLIRDGQSGWRRGDNPFPNIPEDPTLESW